MSLYSEKIEALVDAALADGVLTEKEKQILFKKAQAEGIDLDEFEMVLNARLFELQKSHKKENTNASPKSEKYGDVRKCPACGALVPALAVSCPECGYEFSGVKASSSAQLLAQQISDIQKSMAAKKTEIIASGKYSKKKQVDDRETEQEKVLCDLDRTTNHQINELVNSFPVPNAKDDLFDLIMFLKTNGYSWKYDECMRRASILFPKDPQFLQLQEIERTELENRLVERKRLDKRSNAAFMAIPGFLLLWIGFGIAEWWLLSIGWGWKLLLALLVCPILALFIVKGIKKLYLR